MKVKFIPLWCYWFGVEVLQHPSVYKETNRYMCMKCGIFVVVADILIYTGSEFRFFHRDTKDDEVFPLAPDTWTLCPPNLKTKQCDASTWTSGNKGSPDKADMDLAD